MQWKRRLHQIPCLQQFVASNTILLNVSQLLILSWMMYFVFRRVGAGNLYEGDKPARAPPFDKARQIYLLELFDIRHASQWMRFSAHLHGLGNVFEGIWSMLFSDVFFGCVSRVYCDKIIIIFQYDALCIFMPACFGLVFFGQLVQYHYTLC